jgi:intracellular multiplication protein IcmB
MYPSLKKQFIPDTFDRINSKTLKIGEKYVSSMYIDIPQDEPTPFFDFIKTVDSDVPFQISFKVNGGGLNNIGLKKFLATILAWSPGSNNKIIKEALEYYQQEELSGKTITKNCITINTWAYDEDELSRRKSFLFKSLQGWGSMTPYFSDDDNYEAFFATIPSYTPKTYGNNFIDSFDNILFMLPLTRQANIWEQGCIINRTPDGKIMPYQVASSLQASWNELIFAKPGSGKSVWSNYSNWSFILTPKTDGLTKGKLPFVGIIDIGPSSLGLIKLLQMFLPESRHHEVIYKRLSNSKDDAINMFDTQDGCRQPNDKEREFIVNFITLLLTPAGGETPSSIDAMVNNIVTELYKEYADDKNPKAYEEMEDSEVDDKLKELNITPENRSWWWVTDELFKNNETRLSRKAQKRAVPVLEDCVKIANSVENIKSTYSKPKVQATGENMLDYFNRTISETINNYPLLNTHTHLDLSDARVISLDLNDVAKGGDAAARKKSSIMFMLARFVVTRNFFLEDNTYKFAPKMYKDFLINKTKESRATQKRLCIDELHRTSGIQIFREQIKQDMREGRKWGLSICLISQLLNDFDSEMIDLCNSKFIFSGGDNYQDIVDKFDLNGEVGAIVRTELNGPTHLGVPFVVKFTTKSGEYTQFLYNALSPIEMWAFSSTLADVKMRELAEMSFGIKEGIKILAESFPNGSISGTIEKMQRSDKYARVDDPIGYLMDKLKKKNSAKVRI